MTGFEQAAMIAEVVLTGLGLWIAGFVLAAASKANVAPPPEARR